MIKVMLVDDERPALRELEYLLKDVGGIEVIGAFSDPIKAVEALKELQPQAVFLDINMPQLTGIDAASIILDIAPKTNIIFVTAYDQYAVEAFELYALDYLLKPISYERLEKTINRLGRNTEIKSESTTGVLKICCLGNFNIIREGKEPIKWRTEKTKELFAYLLHSRGKKYTKDEILETLWPDSDPQRSAHQLHNAVYYIRKTLTDYGISQDEVSIDGNYTLKLGKAELDAELFNAAFEDAKSSRSADVLKKCAELYSGEYFEGCGWDWAEAERENLLTNYIAVVFRLSKMYIENGEWEAAEKLLNDAYSKNPYEEHITELLLELFRRTGERIRAAQHYRKFSDMLKCELGVEPSPEIRQIYDGIIKT